jgi:hypothetical protein
VAISKKTNAPANGADVKPVFSAKAKAAIHSEAMLRLANGKQAIKMLRPHIEAYRADKTYVDDAMKILVAVVEDYNANKKPEDKKMAKPQTTRASEFRARVRMADWKCCDDVLDYFEDNTLTDGDVLTLARYLADNVKDRKAKAPPRDVLLQAIKDRKAAKTGRAEGETPKRSAARAIDDAKRLTDGWKAWIGEQPALKKHRAEANDLIRAIVDAAGKLAVLAKTAAV